MKASIDGERIWLEAESQEDDVILLRFVGGATVPTVRMDGPYVALALLPVFRQPSRNFGRRRPRINTNVVITGSDNDPEGWARSALKHRL